MYIQGRACCIASLLIVLFLVPIHQLQAQAIDIGVPTATADQELKVADYKNLQLVVEDLPSNSTGLSKATVQTRSELRMRSVGLKPSVSLVPSRTYLYVNVHIVGGAAQILLELNRPIVWSLPDGSRVSGIASTWSKNLLGIHGGSSAFILDGLDQLLDQFLNAYLKANQ